MLNISSDIVCNIILKIREFQSKEQVVMPTMAPNPSDDTDWAQVLADHSDDLTYQEVFTNISQLEPDQQYELVVLLLVGRGDFSADDFTSAIEEAESVELDP